MTHENSKTLSMIVSREEDEKSQIVAFQPFQAKSNSGLEIGDGLQRDTALHQAIQLWNIAHATLKPLQSTIPAS